MSRLGLHTVDLWERDEGALGPPGATWFDTEQGWNFTLALPACDWSDVIALRRNEFRGAGI